MSHPFAFQPVKSGGIQNGSLVVLVTEAGVVQRLSPEVISL